MEVRFGTQRSNFNRKDVPFKNTQICISTLHRLSAFLTLPPTHPQKKRHGKFHSNFKSKGKLQKLNRVRYDFIRKVRCMQILNAPEHTSNPWLQNFKSQVTKVNKEF